MSKYLSFHQIYDLKVKTDKIGYCDLTANKLFYILYNREYDTYNDVPILEEYDDHDILTKNEYIINHIRNDLFINGISFITISNSTGEDKTFTHIFTLFLTDKGEIIRLESYGKYDYTKRCGNSLYSTRLVEWNSYETDLLKLFSYKPGLERIAYFNGLFSGNETQDTLFDLDVTINLEEL